MKIYELKCRFCDKKTGEYKYPDNLTVADLGIADVRCEDCEIKYGSYKELHDTFLQSVGDHSEFLKVIAKSDYKKSKFDIEISKIKTAMLKPILGGKLKKSPKSGIIK